MSKGRPAGKESDVWRDCKCAVCGKEFTCMSGIWAYKTKRGEDNSIKFFCTWSCLRKYEEKHPYKISKIKRIEQ